MRRHKDKILWAVIVSETSHVFCCVLPTIFSVLSLLSGFGVIAALPAEWTWFHSVMHHYEVPMIVFSAVVLGIGWWLFEVAEKAEAKAEHCHSEACHHGPAAPKKGMTKKILIAATALFLVNVTVYFTLHRDRADAVSHDEMHH